MNHILIILLLISLNSFSQNPIWTNIDKRLIKNIVKMDKENPIEFEEFFIKKKCVMDTLILGFGWKSWSPSIGRGYISIHAKFYYFEDSIVSYEITPELPKEQELVDKYKGWYGDYFNYTNGTLIPIESGMKLISQPLKEYTGPINIDSLNRNILEYMSPNSGNIYGHRGGYRNELLYNRKLFINLPDNLQNTEMRLLMYSINPVSRFTAIEYYLLNKKNFPNSDRIDPWIEHCFEEVPKIKSMNGSEIRRKDSRELVLRYSRMNSFSELLKYCKSVKSTYELEPSEDELNYQVKSFISDEGLLLMSLENYSTDTLELNNDCGLFHFFIEVNMNDSITTYPTWCDHTQFIKYHLKPNEGVKSCHGTISDDWIGKKIRVGIIANEEELYSEWMIAK